MPSALLAESPVLAYIHSLQHHNQQVVRNEIVPTPTQTPTPAPDPVQPVDALTTLLKDMVDTGHALDIATSAESAATRNRQELQAKNDAAVKAFWTELRTRFPDPNPPTPNPNPVNPINPPSPVITAGPIRVLFTYDPMKMDSLTAAQKNILTSPVIRAYLDAHCPKESGCYGGSCPLQATPAPSYLFMTPSADIRQLAPIWQEVWKVVNSSAAFKVYIWDQAKGTSLATQDWPASVDDTLTLLKKYGGN
jgi:hypothetical protein